MSQQWADSHRGGTEEEEGLVYHDDLDRSYEQDPHSPSTNGIMASNNRNSDFLPGTQGPPMRHNSHSSVDDRNNRATGPLQLAPHDDGTSSTVALSPLIQALLIQADTAIQALKAAATDTENWKPVLTHKSGAVVYRTTTHKSAAGNTIPTFKGVAILHGFSPDAIYALIKHRELWDDWYLEGHIVEKINDDTSLTYMAMKPHTAISHAVASERDMALIDRRDFDPSTGTIIYASTSVETSKIPKHPNRVRAFLKLNGWILEPQLAADGFTLSTKLSYYIQTDVGGMLPKTLVKRYLARRALVVIRIEAYLRKHGPPSVPEADVAMYRARTVSLLSSSSDGVHDIRNSFLAGPVINTPLASHGGMVGIPTSSVPASNVNVKYEVPELDVRSDLPGSAHEYHDNQTYHHRRSGSIYSEDGSPDTYVSARGRPTAYDPEVVVYEDVIDDGLHDIDDSLDAIETHPHEQVQENVIADSVEEVAPAPIVVNEPSRNPHHEAGQLALRLLRSLEPFDSAGWVSHSTQSGVRISQRPVAGAQMPMVRGDATLRGNFSAQEVLSVIRSSAARKFWDARFEDGKVLVNYNLDESLAYSQQKGTFPVSGRDFVTTNIIKHPDANSDTDEVDGASGAIFFASTSVVDQVAPLDSKRVRAHLTLAGWIIRPIEDGLFISYIVQVDVKGSVPSSIIKMVQTQTPLCIARVLEYLETKSFPPFIVRQVPGLDPGPPTRLRIEDYDAKTHTFQLEYKKNDVRGKVMAIALPGQYFASGVKVVTSPDNNDILLVESLDLEISHLDEAVKAPKSVVLRLTVLQEGEVDVIVQVKPAVNQWIVNGNALKTGSYVRSPPNISSGSASVTPIRKISPPAELTADVEILPREVAPTANVSPTTNQPHLAPAAEASLSSEQNVKVTPAIKPRSDPVTEQPPKTPSPIPSQVATPPPRSAYVPHRHTESGVKALKYLKGLVGDPKYQWKHYSDQQGVQISTMDEGSTMPVVRGDSTFPAEFSVDDIIAIIRSTGSRKIWDARFDDSTVVEYLNANELVFHALQKGQFPVSGRDISGLQVTLLDGKTGTTYIVGTSVEDPKVPTDTKRVRAHLTVAGWILQQLPASSGGGVQVTYIVNVDPKGNIPSAIVKSVSLQTPMCVAEVRKYLTTFGAPPSAKIVGNTGEGFKVHMNSEQFDHKSREYALEFTVVVDLAVVTAATTSPGATNGSVFSNVAGLMEVSVHPTMYSTGANVVISGGTPVDLLHVKASPDGKAIRFYLRHDVIQSKGVDTIKVKMSIKKASGGKAGNVLLGGAPMDTDSNNRIVVTGGKRRAASITVARKSSEIVVNSTPAATLEASPDVRCKAPSLTPDREQTLTSMIESKSPAPIAESISTPVIGINEPHKSMLTRADNTNPLIATGPITVFGLPLPPTLVLTFTILLRLFRPFLAPYAKQPNLPDTTDPSDLRAHLQDVDHKRLGAASLALSLVVFLILNWIIGGVIYIVGGIFTLMSSWSVWIVAAAAGAGAAAYVNRQQSLPSPPVH